MIRENVFEDFKESSVMKQIIEVIYKNGVLVPLQKLNLKENEKVKIKIIRNENIKEKYIKLVLRDLKKEKVTPELYNLALYLLGLKTENVEYSLEKELEFLRKMREKGKKRIKE